MKGFVPPVIDRPSPNFDARPAGARPWILLLHYTGMPTAEAALTRLTDPAARVSSHYTVDEDGTVYRHVVEEMRAWHAGVSSWRGETNVNAHSIGIEIVNPGHEFGYRPFPEEQVLSVIALCQAIRARHGIARQDVIGHSDVAPLRKEDPGELFPWGRLATEHLCLWPDHVPAVSGAVYALGEQGPAISGLHEKLTAIGYGYLSGDQFDPHTEKVITAFQRRFRQSAVTGAADPQTQGLIQAVLDQTAPATPHSKTDRGAG